MRILLIMPDARIHKLSLCGHGISFREAPLTLSTLAALVPTEIDADIALVDESVSVLKIVPGYDIVGISCLTGTSLRAYEIAAAFRNVGSTVILGGVHVTLCPEEAMQNADAIVKGFAESTWPQLLRDFARGKLKTVYEDFTPSLEKVPSPLRTLQKRFSYMLPKTVFATRGCRGSCRFCSIPAGNYGWQTRPVQNVVDDIRSFRNRRFAFNDVNLLEDRDYAMELLTALIPLKREWGGLAKTETGSDPELLALLRQSGCKFLLMGFESITEGSLASIDKGFNTVTNYKRIVENMHAHGIVVQGCFIFGLDGDQADVFEHTVEYVNELGIDIPRYALCTPYPGTPVFDKLRREGRLRHKRWDHYDTQHVVFEPKNMTAEALDTGFIRAYEKTFAMNSVRKRTAVSPSRLISFIGNLAYRRYIHRLKNERVRMYPREDL